MIVKVYIIGLKFDIKFYCFYSYVKILIREKLIHRNLEQKKVRTLLALHGKKQRPVNVLLKLTVPPIRGEGELINKGRKVCFLFILVILAIPKGNEEWVYSRLKCRQESTS